MSNVRKAKHGWIFYHYIYYFKCTVGTSDCNRIYELL